MALLPSTPTPLSHRASTGTGTDNAPTRRKLPRRQPASQKSQTLKIIPYNPDRTERKATRRSLAIAQPSPEATAEDAEQEEQAFNKRQTDLLRNVERIPSTRSWDPFNALAVLYISKEERFILNYAYTRSWKVWEDPFSGANKFAQAWMWRSMESPAAFYAQIVGAASHYQICRRETPISSEKLATVRLQAKSKAIERLRSEIGQYHRKAASVPFDSLLMAVFCLAVHDNIDVRGQTEPHPFSALAKLRDMHIYGRVVFGDEHMSAMYQLIEQKGGLDCIDEHAFGPVVPLLDVIYAIRSGKKPKFACKKTLKSIRHPSIWEPDERAKGLLDVLGSSFADDENLPFSLDERLRTIILVVAEMTAGLDHFQRCGAKPFNNLLAMLDNTDWAAHRLSSMSAFEKEDSQALHEDIGNEICRLTTLLYVDMVSFPTAPQAGVKDTLSQELLDKITTLTDSGSWMEVDLLKSLILWTAIIGAIASQGLELQDAFTEFIADAFVSEDGMAWDEVKACMVTFLWVDVVCDEPARRVWEAACTYGQVGDDYSTPT